MIVEILMYADNLSLSVAEALLRTQHPKGERPRFEVERPHAVIALSREAGAQGETVAREVGRQLGCPVYGHEVVNKVAEELRQPAAQLQRMDERPTFWIEDWVNGFYGPRNLVSMDVYVKYMIATIRGLAELGRCVFVGRGAPFTLPAENTLRVRLIADRPHRIRTVQALRHLSESEAAAWIDHTEAERTAFARRNFKLDPADPHLYDLVLSTSRMPVADCAELIVAALSRLETRVAGHPKPGAEAPRAVGHTSR